jgi:hypothetical protein
LCYQRTKAASFEPAKEAKRLGRLHCAVHPATIISVAAEQLSAGPFLFISIDPKWTRPRKLLRHNSRRITGQLQMPQTPIPSSPEKSVVLLYLLLITKLFGFYKHTRALEIKKPPVMVDSSLNNLLKYSNRHINHHAEIQLLIGQHRGQTAVGTFIFLL